MANNYGRFSESDYGNYTDIMNQYRDIASGGGSSSGGGGGGGGGGIAGTYTPFTVNPGRAGYSDPFESYGGYKEFSRTGGYSDADMANMRARGIAPIRAAYSNAQNEIGRARSLQGGYAPNAIAAQVKMAREQGQGMADASTNVEAALAQMKQAGRLSGLGGMSNIEGQRLNADVDVSKYNTGLDFQGQTYNAGANERAQDKNIQAAEAAASRRAAASANDMQTRLAALGGMRSMYGTTPGASQLFGNQVSDIVGQGGNFGTNMINADIRSQQLPGQWDQTMGRVNDIMDVYNTGSTVANAFLKDRRNQTQPQQTWQPPQVPAGYYGDSAGYGGADGGNVDPWGYEDPYYIPG
jgi:hypothetical protein